MLHVFALGNMLAEVKTQGHKDVWIWEHLFLSSDVILGLPIVDFSNETEFL